MTTNSQGLRVQGLKKKYPEFVVCADFQIASGERVTLQGRSGSGKTTLLRILAGLDPMGPLDEGKIWLGQEDLTWQKPEARQIGMVFQDQALFPTLSVLENTVFGLKMRGVPKSERLELGLEWLDRISMKQFAHHSIQKLSGGERQRVAFVRAIIWKPRLLLLDEPFSALDASMRAEIRRFLIELHQLWPVPLLLVTHDREDEIAIATARIAYEEMDQGATRRFSRS